MKTPFAVLVLVVAALALLAPTKDARADPIVWGDMYQFQSGPDLDVMELRAVSIRGEKAQRVADRPDKRLLDEHGFFSPRWYYSTGSDVDQNDPARIPNKTNDFVREPLHFDCTLSAGLAELVILPEPLVIFIVSGDEWWKPVGEDFQSISVSFRITGRLILDDIPFHRWEDDAGISRLLYNAAENRFSLKGRFGLSPGQQQPVPDAYRYRETTEELVIDPNYITIPRRAEPPALPSTIRLGLLAVEDVYRPVRTSEPDPDHYGYACQYYGVDYLAPHRPAVRPNRPPSELNFAGL